MKPYSLLSFIACLFLFSCPPPASPIEDTKVEMADAVQSEEQTAAKCSTFAMVKDYTGNDGCRFLFELNNGDKLLPNEMPLMDFKLANNQAVNIDYAIIRDGVSACMMESHIVRITCITLIGQTGGIKPAKTPCVKVNNYIESKWLKSIAGDMNPYIVTRFDYLEDGWAYLLDNGLEKKLFDCQGALMCSVEGKAMNECTTKIKNMGEGTVIHATKPPRN